MTTMSRDLTHAHYLHAKGGLEALFRPPVGVPGSVAWKPKSEELLVGNTEGILFSVDPVMGTSQVAADLGEVVRIVCHPTDGRVWVMNSEGYWSILRGSEVLQTGHFPFVRGVQAFFHKAFLVMTGSKDVTREVHIWKGQHRAARIAVPDRSVPAPAPDGRLVLYRSTQAGLEVIPLTRQPTPSDIPTTAHSMRVFPTRVVGFTALGLVSWNRENIKETVSMRLMDLGEVAMNATGELVAMGTRSGAVAMSRLSSAEQRARPTLVHAFDARTRALAFSERGRWLATAGDHLVVWSWED